ncbi:hypothetical protein [Agrococcus casei]|uniref:hypothetical protein n=1 Tax=Agrococcus casei TaxID=343512 RepID=UPI003F910EF3
MVLRSLRLLIPALWLGLIIGISLIETPLKFQAPGMTIPLGLGIGRLVFGVMNIVEAVFAIVLLIAMWGARPPKTEWLLGLAVAAVLAAKALIIRPIMQSTTDAVVAGTREAGGNLHLLYIAADGILIVLLVWLLVASARTLLRHSPSARTVD